MEAIKTYLENMFMNLPDTEELNRAKKELLQMMEDKYTELKEEGKSENEAVGIVISEFGNLDEVAESLGISDLLKKSKSGESSEETLEDNGDKKRVSLDEAKQYIKLKAKNAVMVGLGVALCIFSIIGTMMSDMLEDKGYLNANAADATGVCIFFVLIAIAVGLFIVAGVMVKDYDFINRARFILDSDAKAYVIEKRKAYRTKYAVFIAVGVIMCVMCLVPVMLAEGFTSGHIEAGFVSTAGMFLFIGIGVFFIVMANISEGAYEKLLKQTRKQKILSGNTAEAEAPLYKNETIKTVMQLFWPTVSCIYVCWSFLTFDWNITWIIWLIASVIYAVLGVFGKE